MPSIPCETLDLHDYRPSHGSRLYRAEAFAELEKATVALLISSSNAVGAHMARSPALGVIRLRTRLTAEKATTIHTSQREARDHPGRASPARASTTAAIPARTAAWIKAAIRSTGGNCPGNAPPIAYAPHGAPAARAIWNRTTIKDTKA